MVPSVKHTGANSKQQVVQIAVNLSGAADVELDGRPVLDGGNRRLVTIELIVQLVLNHGRLEKHHFAEHVLNLARVRLALVTADLLQTDRHCVRLKVVVL